MGHWIWPLTTGDFKEKKLYIAFIELGLTEMKDLVLKNNNVETLLYRVCVIESCNLVSYVFLCVCVYELCIESSCCITLGNFKGVFFFKGECS